MDDYDKEALDITVDYLNLLGGQDRRRQGPRRPATSLALTNGAATATD